MSASDSRRESLAGLTLDDILGKQKRAETAHQIKQFIPKSRTLLDIIRDDETNKKDRRSWKAFKDKIRLKRAGSAWTSSIHIPTSDIPVPHPNSRTFTQLGRQNSVRFQTQSNSDASTHNMDAHLPQDPIDCSSSPTPALPTRAQFSRKSSTRFGSPGDAFTAGDPTEPGGGGLRPQLSRRNSTNVNSEPYRRGRVVTFRDSFDDDEPEDDDGGRSDSGRALSAREAVAAQEAAEAAAAVDDEEEAAGQPMTMSLMDLLEETDREMGLEGSRYILSDDDEFDDEEEEDEGEEGEDGGGYGMEFTCSVCMVKHKANAISTCGHSYCRMCSRELMVNKGNCPLCNKFISEILDIF